MAASCPLLLQAATQTLADITPVQLRCESQDDPLAIQSETPLFSWLLTPAHTGLRNLHQTGYRILVASSPVLLSKAQGDLWDSGLVRLPATQEIRYAGKALASFTRYYWAVRIWDGTDQSSDWSKPASFRMGVLQESDWKARWISQRNLQGSDPLPVFHRSFALRKPIAEAIAYVTGLGQYELQVNGKKAGDLVLVPGWTNYRKTVFYNSYDITGLLKPGNNGLGILVGNGMYNVEKTPGRYTKFVGSFGVPALLFQARIVFTDGTSEDLISDSSWLCRAGPITFSSPYGGEDYDAQLAPPGWNNAQVSPSDWSRASEVSGPGGKLVSQKNPPVKVQHVYRTERITQPKPGFFVYDLGQNFAGWPEIVVEGKAGSHIKLVAGELLSPDGLVQQTSSGGPQWFSYTLNGQGVETWHPRFSYYGFRYVQIETSSPIGVPPPHIQTVMGQAVYADAEHIGEFRCSDELFNRIHRLIDAAIQSNLQNVLTDCPHREKLGWLEETHLLASSVMYNFDVARMYDKIADDIEQAQSPNGFVPEIAPEYVIFPPPFHDSPEWSSATVLDPWLVYQQYGTLEDMSAHYSSMQNYVNYLGTKTETGIISYGLGDWYDIGPGAPGVSKLTSLGLTATAIYYADLVVMQQVASLLDKTADSEHYSRLASLVRDEFNAKFYAPSMHVYDRGSQTAYAMPLALGLVPSAEHSAVLDKLVADIRAHSNHVTAGDIGFHFVVEALTAGGRSDVLYDMLSRTDAPSYGYQLAKGATTLTEAWDANPHSSQNHFMLGHAEEWFYRALAGVDVDFSRNPAERFTIRPTPVGSITEAQATYHSSVGDISAHWQQKGQQFVLDVVVPPNQQATVHIPTTRPASVLESGLPLNELSPATVLSRDANTVVCRIGSGEYHFVADRKI